MEMSEEGEKSSKRESFWSRPSVEDYYSPFDPHFDTCDSEDELDDEELDRRLVASKGAFACLSAEILLRVSGFLDLESLCRMSSLSRALKKFFDSSYVWSARIQSCLSLPTSQLADISDKKHWFLYQMCIAPYRRTIKTMCIQDKLELEFEERLLYQKISYNTWALPLRLLHSPLQDNVTVLLLILQSVLVFCKLEGYLDLWPWVCIFAPVWIFDLLFFVCCVIWFYFLAKSLLPQDYADTCLSGWLKDVLEAVQLGHIWSDYLKFASVSLLAFLVFPLFLVLQLDVFFGLYLYGSVLSPSELSGDDSTQTKVHAPQKSSPMSWTAVFSPLVVASLLVLHMLHKRYVFLRQNRRRNRLGMVAFLILVDLCALAFCVLIALQLDKWSYLPAWWTWWHTSTPVWIAAAIATIMIGEGFNFTLRANWWRRLQRTPYSITRAPLIGLLAVFLGIVFYRAEQARTGGNVETSVLFPFSFLFGLQSVLVLYWVQDLVDFDGHKSYTMRKKFNFNLQEANSAAMQEQLAEQDDLDDVPLVHL